MAVVEVWPTKTRVGWSGRLRLRPVHGEGDHGVDDAGGAGRGEEPVVGQLTDKAKPKSKKMFHHGWGGAACECV
jgi:hypothetical protein